MTINCIVCGKESRSYDKRRSMKYCSQECYKKDRKNKPKILNCKCSVCGKLFHRKPSEISSRKITYCSWACKQEGQKVDPNESYNERHLLRQSTEYKVWRRAALKLHENKCDRCGKLNRSTCEHCEETNYLHIHHIKPFSQFKELRFDPTNSTVLCSKCHKAIENNLR